MDVDAFFRRIAYTGPRAPTAANLAAIHRAFLLAVPFENLDIHLGRRIILDEEAFFEKIVQEKRGGFCYELNRLFADLLRNLGYDATLLSARVFDAEGELGREFVHLLLLVECQGRWIADVGFGDSFLEPICLDKSTDRFDQKVGYRLVLENDWYVLQKRQTNGQWQSRYSFAPMPRQLADFAAMCEDLQTSSDSIFRRQRMCTRATDNGRITLVENGVIVTEDNRRYEIPLSEELTYEAALRKYFGIVLPDRLGWKG